MEKINGYENAKKITEAGKLPVGGYEITILKVEEAKYDWGNVLLLYFDISKGEYIAYYNKQFSNQQTEDKKWKGVYRLNVPKGDNSEKDNWTMRKFKTVISNIEESNPGYHWNWDESTLVGKECGALFHEREYEIDGKTGTYVACHSLIPIEKIRAGKFTLPAPYLLPKTSQASVGDGFVNVPEGLGEELPF